MSPAAILDDLGQLVDTTFTAPQLWGIFFGLLLVTWIIARVFASQVLARILRARRIEAAIVHLVARLFVFVGLIIAIFVYASLLFSANLAALAATLGLVSLAIGFGMQNTIANIAGGISLAVDRPFRIGDQVQVENIVGDVQAIGIRSTRILTRQKTYVVIPNKFLEEKPIINYTMAYPDYRLDVPVSISYDSDRRLAEDVMVEVAVHHPVVLRRPAPRVVLREFGDSGLQLELRCWVSHPRDRTIVRSDLLKSFQDRFEEEGVEIPFPYRTLVQRSELPKPKKRPPQERGVKASRPQRRALVALTGRATGSSQIEYALNLAKALGSPVVALYTAQTDDEDDRRAAGQLFHWMETEAEHRGIWFKPILRLHAKTASAIVEVSEDEDVDMVLLVSPRGRLGLEWPLHGPPLPSVEELKEAGLRPPAVEIAPDARLGPRDPERFESIMKNYRGAPAAKAVVVSPPEPKTSEVPSPLPEGKRRAAPEAPEAEGKGGDAET